jgi:succinate dehydrogenase/fumarate reductase-like Fe-S protein
VMLKFLVILDEFNPELDKAGRVADFIELGELMCKDALDRNESCGGHLEKNHKQKKAKHFVMMKIINMLLHGNLKMKSEWQLHKEELIYENIKIAATVLINNCAFKDGDTIVIEPWRAKAFPVIKDLVVDRTAFDRIIQAGGYISVNTGNAVDANAIPIPKDDADKAFAAAACIGCGACVAACKNASAMLFVSAKVSQLALLPQGKPEAQKRVLDMVAQMDKEGFGSCTNTGACEAECPKEISLENIARLNREFTAASLASEE